MDEAVNGEYIWEGIKPSPVRSEYRNKMEFSFGDEYKDGPLALGMHKRGSFHDIVNVTDCQIVDEDYRKILGRFIFLRGVLRSEIQNHTILIFPDQLTRSGGAL